MIGGKFEPNTRYYRMYEKKIVNIYLRAVEVNLTEVVHFFYLDAKFYLMNSIKHLVNLDFHSQGWRGTGLWHHLPAYEHSKIIAS